MSLDAPLLTPRRPAAPARPGVREGQRVQALLAGLGGAVVVRVAMAGPAGVRSAPAGLVFAALLLALTVTAGTRAVLAPGSPRRQLTTGLGGAAVLCAVPLVVHIRTPGAALPVGELPMWAAIVTVVAVAEEALLRGALWSAAERWRGTRTALPATTFAFALLHVPLYGWEVLPLDLAVGLLLGGLRMAAGGWGAPAVAHTVADLAGWWLR